MQFTSVSTSFAQLLRSVFAFVTPDYLRSLLLLYQDIRAFLKKERGLYEILEYESNLELLDPTGATAKLTKRQRVKFLQDSVLAFQDYAWGDGETLATYECSPGIVADRYKEGDRWNILISLRKTKNSGDIEEFYMARTINQGFTSENEWNQVEVRHKTQRLRMCVVFPKERHCRSAQVVTRSQHTTQELGPKHLIRLPDGRQQLTFETANIKHLEIYTLKWHW
jgi:hypothetical protein